MARSWRNFFRRGTDEENPQGQAVASEPEPSTETGNGHHSVDLETAEVEAPVREAAEVESLVEDVPTAEEVQAQRDEPAPADVWEVEEPVSGEVEESLPEPTAIEEAAATRLPRRRSRRDGLGGSGRGSAAVELRSSVS